MSEQTDLIPVNDPNEIPENLSDEEELEFWETHYMTDAYMSKVEEVSKEERPQARSSSKQINVRMEESTIERLRSLAENRGIGYQTLMKDFIKERLYEEEIREGTVERGTESGSIFSVPNRFPGSIFHESIPFLSTKNFPQIGEATWRRSSRISENFYMVLINKLERLRNSQSSPTYTDSWKIAEHLIKPTRGTIRNMGDIPIARKREDK